MLCDPRSCLQQFSPCCLSPHRGLTFSWGAQQADVFITTFTSLFGGMPVIYRPFVSVGLAFIATLQIWEDKLRITKVSCSLPFGHLRLTWWPGRLAGNIRAMVISSDASDIPNVRKQRRCTAWLLLRDGSTLFSCNLLGLRLRVAMSKLTLESRYVSMCGSKCATRNWNFNQTTRDSKRLWKSLRVNLALKLRLSFAYGQSYGDHLPFTF